MEFYYAPMSCAFASHVLLEDAQAMYTAKRIDLKKGDQNKPNFLKINPKGRVPALITSKGILTETPAIMCYICMLYPEKKLAPSDPYELAEAQAFNMYLSSTVHVGHAHKHRGQRWTYDEHALSSLTAQVKSNMTSYAEYIEKNLIKGPWVLGKNYSMCDPYLALVTRWFRDDGVDMNKFPLIIQHNENFNKRDNVKKITDLHQ